MSASDDSSLEADGPLAAPLLPFARKVRFAPLLGHSATPCSPPEADILVPTPIAIFGRRSSTNTNQLCFSGDPQEPGAQQPTSGSRHCPGPAPSFRGSFLPRIAQHLNGLGGASRPPLPT